MRQEILILKVRDGQNKIKISMAVSRIAREQKAQDKQNHGDETKENQKVLLQKRMKKNFWN